MKNKVTALALFAIMMSVFAYMRTHNTMPSDFRDAVADFSADEGFTAALSDIKTKDPAASNLDIRPVRAENDAVSEVAKVVAKVRPSVVKVETNYGTGSGFIIDKSGIIATNAHVVNPVKVGGMVDLYIEGQNGPQQGVVIAVGSPKKRDIAFVQIQSPRKDWKALSLKPALNIGDQVLAIGYPKGLPFSVSRGIISADTLPEEYFTAVQTDAAINPGNSGGPLLAMDGAVVGMNTFILTKGGGSEGLGFAIVAEEIDRAMKQYRKLGHIKTSSLGAIISLEREVTAMLPGSAAEKAGIMHNDVITRFNGKEISDTNSFLKQLRAFMPEDRVYVGVLRNDKPIEFPVILEAEREMPLMRLATADAEQLPV